MILKFIRRPLKGKITREGIERGQFTEENSACTIITNKKLSTKNASEFLVKSDCVFHYFYYFYYYYTITHS